MNASRLVADPLWQCLCPAWTSRLTRIPSAHRIATRKKRLPLQCLQTPAFTRAKSDAQMRYQVYLSRDNGKKDSVLSPLAETPVPSHRERMASAADAILNSMSPSEDPDHQRTLDTPSLVDPSFTKISPGNLLGYKSESTASLYSRLHSDAIDGKVHECRTLAEYLVEERGEKPSHSIYSALILSNIHIRDGSAWRVGELLDEMRDDGLQPDSRTCHAALKALSVHLDHLLRMDILEHMDRRWIQLTEDGAHDVVAGLLREGLLEQGVERLSQMQAERMAIKPWLLDMTIYILCEANEISEAHRFMLYRFDAVNAQNIGRSLWSFFLDKASAARHHAGTALAWSSQVNQSYLNPSSGVCLNILATAAQAADAVMATEVFTLLSKRGTPFQPIHYELLMSTYLATEPPDLTRAITVLTIMAGEKQEPSSVETRSFYHYFLSNPNSVDTALQILEDLHAQGRIIPIAALNMLIEIHVENNDLDAAMKVYKQIHTFVPLSAGVQKTFANIETFNLLLKGCRNGEEAPDTDEATFLVSEMRALGIKPQALTYDRLILVFAKAVDHMSPLDAIERPTGPAEQITEALDNAFAHFTQMLEHNMLPRPGTLQMLGNLLARNGDARCWQVVQTADELGRSTAAWIVNGSWVKRTVEKEWEKWQDGRMEGEDHMEDGDQVQQRKRLERVSLG